MGWLSTAARHSLGAVCEMRHGAASCIALPEAMRFHADATRDRQRSLASALGWTPDPEVPLAPGLSELLQGLGVPRRLGDLGIGPDALGEVVAAMLAEAPSLGSEQELRDACERML
jgi:alcohol dehydrogenase class IV